MTSSLSGGTVPVAISAPVTGGVAYTVPHGQVVNLQAVRAVFDGTSSSGAFLPCVQILNTNGQVIVETIGSSVAQGGSADASFFPFVRTTSSTGPATSYPAAILASSGLYAYWRLGESVTPFLDTSGKFPISPGNANRVTRGTAYTTHVQGALPLGSDDGALQFNSGPAAGDYLQVSAGSGGRYDFADAGAAFSVAGWVKPNASASAFTAAIISNYYSSPPSGWNFYIQYPSMTLVYIRKSGSNQTFVSSTGLTAAAWNHVAATYDGANTMNLYINGSLVNTNGSAGNAADQWNNGPQIGGGAPNASQDFYFNGVIDELALWNVALTGAFISSIALLGG